MFLSYGVSEQSGCSSVAPETTLIGWSLLGFGGWSKAGDPDQVSSTWGKTLDKMSVGLEGKREAVRINLTKRGMLKNTGYNPK